MTDDWLRDHDPDYVPMASPSQEIAVGGSEELTAIGASGPVGPVDRTCDRCYRLFVATDVDRRFCSSRCEQSSRPKRNNYQRDLMRDRRNDPMRRAAENARRRELRRLRRHLTSE